MISYLEHFHTFIRKKLPTYNDTFTVKDAIDWVQSREPQRRPQNIRDHLLKRTTNYKERVKFVPPPGSADDLFFGIPPNLFRRYQLGVDPEPFHLSREATEGGVVITSTEEDRKNRPLVAVRKKTLPVKVMPTFGDVLSRFKTAVAKLDEALAGRSLEDEIVSTSVRAWLDGNNEPMAWTLSEGLTDDEWFFVTTLYGTMTPDGQRTHIRKFFPTLFVKAAKRDVRNFIPGMPAYDGLRSPSWMPQRLSRMGEILRERNISMSGYVAGLRQLERSATPYNPMPALDAIVMDHRASGRKTLSVFIRDCVLGNCFPIDSRVSNQLAEFGLPEDERLLVSLSLELRRNPRQVARMFYELG